MQSEPVFGSSTSLVVYTTIMGGNYTLPVVSSNQKTSYVCFTDDQYFDAHGWQIVQVEPVLAHDLPRSSRESKICPHRYFPNVDRSIYIDPSVELLDDPQNIWDEVMTEYSIFGGFYHSFRDTLLDEFIAVFDQQLDGAGVLAEQFNTYSHLGTQELNQKPVWGGFLLRRHNDQHCKETMERWFAHVLRYSRRDQLSLPVILGLLSDSQRRIIHLDNHQSKFHRWPRADYKRPADYIESSQPKLFPTTYELRQAENRIAMLEGDIENLRSVIRQNEVIRKENELLIRELENNLSKCSEETDCCQQTADDLRNIIHRKNQRIDNLIAQLSAIRRSKSYRLANSLAKLFAFGKRNKQVH